MPHHPQTIIKTIYSTSPDVINKYRAVLNELGVEFTTKDVFSTFWGTQFNIIKPTGRGCGVKTNLIYKLFEK